MKMLRTRPRRSFIAFGVTPSTSFIIFLNHPSSAIISSSLNVGELGCLHTPSLDYLRQRDPTVKVPFGNWAERKERMLGVWKDGPRSYVGPQISLSDQVVIRGAAELVYRWQLVSFRAAARMAGQPPEKEERDKQRQKGRRRLIITIGGVGVGVFTTAEMIVAAISVEGAEVWRTINRATSAVILVDESGKLRRRI
jgi:hypothetical protein